MRVAFFTDNFLPQRDGVVTSVIASAVELGRRGHHVLIVAPKPVKRPVMPFLSAKVRVCFVQSVPAMVYPGYRIGVPMTSAMIRELKKFNPDVIHLHTPWVMGHSAHLAAKLLDIPLVGTNHIFLTKDNARSLCIFPGAKLLEKHIGEVGSLYIRAFYDPCDGCIAPSRSLIRGLRTSGCRKRFAYVPNGVALSNIRTLTAKEKDVLRRAYGLHDQVIVHVGRLAKEKSVDDLLRAFAHLRKTMKYVSLLIIGDGPMRLPLKRLQKRLGVQESVVFAGSIPHDELLSSGILGIADCFATASRSENHPMVVIEAMSHGLPIVACREGGMSDLISGNGILVSPGNLRAFAEAMKSVLQDPVRKKRMSKASTERVQEFSIRRTTTLLIEEYRKAIATSKKKVKKKRLFDAFTTVATRPLSSQRGRAGAKKRR